MPVLPLPHQRVDMMNTDWSPSGSYEPAILLGGPVNQSGALNREARVLRFAAPTVRVVLLFLCQPWAKVIVYMLVCDKEFEVWSAKIYYDSSS